MNLQEPIFEQHEPIQGMACVALWQDRGVLSEADVWGQGFYDFSKPVFMLNSGWPQLLEGHYDQGFFKMREKSR